jgi:ferritin-like metal-binding protein YciE
VANEVNARDAKLIQYLNEAYGKEKQQETALQAHITLTTRDTYKKRLQQHLKETKGHSKQLERRIKKLGGTADAGAGLPGPDSVTETVANIAGRAVAAAQGPLHALRGTGVAEKMLKNAKDEYHEEAEEIANYTAIETLAQICGDKETQQLAKSIKREEERMAKFLEKLIPTLTKAVATEEIPASERKTSSSRRKSSASRSRSGGSSSRSSARSGGSSSRSGGSKSSRSSSARKSGGSSSSSRSSSARKSGGSSSSSRSSSARKSGGSSSRSSSSRSSSARKSSGSSSSRNSGGSSSSRSSSSRSSGGSSRSGGRSKASKS